MSDLTQQTLSPTLQLEFDALRDQRDLYRSLLLSEPERLAVFLQQGLEIVDGIRTGLQTPTREAPAFRAKIERLQMELMALEQSLVGLELPTVSWRLQHVTAAVNDVMLRADISGNDLLPAVVLLEDLCSHLLIAADTAAMHVPLTEHGVDDADAESNEARARSALATALKQLNEKLCAEHGKRVSLVTVGMEDIPEAWGSALFDLLGQLLRNTIEHGIEPPTQRAALLKPETGTMAIEFADRGPTGYELHVQDDGAGLDAARIAEAGVRLGLLSADAPRPLEPSRVINLIFQSGVSTAQDPVRRGFGLQIVRDHVQRLGGKLHLAAKRGQFVRFQITLPPLGGSA